MTTTTETMDIAELGRRIDNAYERTKIGRAEWVEGSLELAAALIEARDMFPSNNNLFSSWLAENGHNHLGKNDQAGLINLGRDPVEARRVLEDTKSISYELIWRDARAGYPIDRTTKPEPTSIPNPPSSPATEPKPEESKVPNVETATQKSGDSKSTKKKSASRLYELGDAVADTLLAKFAHTKMLTHFLGGKDADASRRARLLRYLAKRVEANYPEELLSHGSWDVKLLYPYLPQKMLDTLAKNLKLVHRNHLALSATEELFMRTPEFGVIDPPNVAFNKAWSIYQSVIHGKGTSAPGSHTHKPTFADDGGKPPIVVRGTQLWPAEIGTGYCYDDLRCAYNLAKDILLTFDEPKDSPMSTKSLKLRHIMSWLPGGYNSFGSSIDGTLKALAAVVHAYGANKSEMMRAPLPSLKKVGDG